MCSGAVGGFAASMGTVARRMCVLLPRKSPDSTVLPPSAARRPTRRRSGATSRSGSARPARTGCPACVDQRPLRRSPNSPLTSLGSIGSDGRRSRNASVAIAVVRTSSLMYQCSVAGRRGSRISAVRVPCGSAALDQPVEQRDHRRVLRADVLRQRTRQERLAEARQLRLLLEQLGRVARVRLSPAGPARARRRRGSPSRRARCARPRRR